MKRIRGIVLVLIGLAVMGCHSGDDQQPQTMNSNFGSVDSALTNIHAFYNRQEFKALYDQASKSAQEQFEKEQFITFISGIRDKLGKIKNANIQDQKGSEEAGRRVIVDVEYENDSGTERWTLVNYNDRWRWDQFNYNAPSLRGPN